uniref:sigma 54-interacting transcriptional regulator n=1 Tax=Cupriavidus metallidurans TaxID=119219 RepID=UPI0005677B0E
LAHNSTLFFDEMGDMPPEIQVKLLRVLQDGMFERIGGQRLTHSDFRLISASNRNFEEMIGNGEFRLDLYYRISGVTVRMPSLRERLDDIPLLVERFLAAFAKRHNSSVKSVDRRVYDFLREQQWPGNIRQLLHEVEKAAIFCDGPEVNVSSFRMMDGGLGVRTLAMSSGLAQTSPNNLGPLPSFAPPVEADGAKVGALTESDAPSILRSNIPDAVAALEQSMIRDAMTRHQGNKKKVAQELGISRAYLYKKLAASASVSS